MGYLPYSITGRFWPLRRAFDFSKIKMFPVGRGMAKTDRQTDRASSWSITINNPSEEDYLVELPAGWVLEGQLEVGAEGTTHYQGYLKTTQVRFSAVKKVFPRAHIEVARNVQALKQYVHKEDTRLSLVPTQQSSHVSMFSYMHTLAQSWDAKEFEENYADRLADFGSLEECRLAYVDHLISRHIMEDLMEGVEYIGVNPMFRNAWKRYGFAIVERERRRRELAESQTECTERLVEVVEVDRQTDRQEEE